PRFAASGRTDEGRPLAIIRPIIQSNSVGPHSTPLNADHPQSRLRADLKHAMRYQLAVLNLVDAPALGVRADEQVDETIVARLKMEACQHSRVMDTLSELTDVYGARLRGSPGYGAAAAWGKHR